MHISLVVLWNNLYQNYHQPGTLLIFFFSRFLLKGCDGSILIATKPGSKELAEKDALGNKDLRVEGFESIRKAKALVESKCPGVVSCADILAIAARDYVHLVSKFSFSVLADSFRFVPIAFICWISCLLSKKEKKIK